jgi:hypothetical protein
MKAKIKLSELDGYKDRMKRWKELKQAKKDLLKNLKLIKNRTKRKAIRKILDFPKELDNPFIMYMWYIGLMAQTQLILSQPDKPKKITKGAIVELPEKMTSAFTDLKARISSGITNDDKEIIITSRVSYDS